MNEPNLTDAVRQLKFALDEAERNNALNTLVHAERAVEITRSVIEYRFNHEKISLMIIPAGDGTPRQESKP